MDQSYNLQLVQSIVMVAKNIIIIIEWIHSSYTGWPSKFSYNYNNVNGKENPAKFSV